MDMDFDKKKKLKTRRVGNIVLNPKKEDLMSEKTESPMYLSDSTFFDDILEEMRENAYLDRNQ